MLLIACPHCGERDEIEFICGGEADRPRPIDPSDLDDVEWADFLFMRRNEKGWRRERWRHGLGCGRWFVLERHTGTHALRSPEKEA